MAANAAEQLDRMDPAPMNAANLLRWRAEEQQELADKEKQELPDKDAKPPTPAYVLCLVKMPELLALPHERLSAASPPISVYKTLGAYYKDHEHERVPVDPIAVAARLRAMYKSWDKGCTCPVKRSLFKLARKAHDSAVAAAASADVAVKIARTGHDTATAAAAAAAAGGGCAVHTQK